MIYGIGTDITEIDRIDSLLDRAGFKERVFSEAELEAFSKLKSRARKLTGCFSVKESFSKALGTGVSGFSLKEVSVLRDDRGKPYIEFTGNALEMMTSKGLSAMVTISDTDSLVVSFVLIEKKDGDPE
ncbi:MAG: holo-ACP synthase [Oscillospiraceae bacterium]|jgi:holo-[acyl-carrier protein] synthase